MSTVIQSLAIPKGWTKAYISQLATYVRERDREGYCYGNRELFEKRHKAILKWVEGYEEYCDAPDVVFKKKDK
jgi:hypothetical protein